MRNEIVGRVESGSTGAPDSKNEIEITPVMIEAGLSGLFSYDPKTDIPEEAVTAIFIAMVKASSAYRQ
jgi:hypothetical protein